ncbi:MAG: M20/M25/M40 family metallo-hydrolase [Phycisphaerales bacterium]|nr:M20/M25/M40 family metallo-hydrolase [Phycisphaerales bacterium]
MNIDLLKRLCETPGVPGRENRVRELIKKEIKGLFDEVREDPMGNLLCRRDPRGGAKSKGKGKEPTRVMLPCHMDEIGFLVSQIDAKGFIRVNAVGGFDTRNLFSRRVMVCTKKGDLLGVMNPGGRPIHISSDEERKKVPEVKEFMIDLGLPAEEVKKRVTIGDMVVMHEPFLEIGDKVVSKALDNRIACWLGVESVRALDKSGDAHAAEIHVAFTVQEEVGLRGARTAAASIRPDWAIGLDVSLSCDTPGVPEEESVTRQGEGAGLHVMDSSFISDPELIDDLEAIAKKHKIPVQRTILARGGQDGAAAQQIGLGCRAAGLVVGTRYIHTVTEMVDKRDLKAACDLLAKWMPTVE